MSVAGSIEVYAGNISPLIDRAKLSTLGKRGANPRVRKYVYWLGVARLNKTDPRQVATQAVRDAGYEGEAASAILIFEGDISRGSPCPALLTIPAQAGV